VLDRVVETVATTLDLAGAFLTLFSTAGQSVVARSGTERELPLVPESACEAAGGRELVAFEPGAAGTALRFYAGVPLRSDDGTTLGALCLLDRHPRKLTSGQGSFVRGMAGIAVAELETQAGLARAAAANEHLRAVINASPAPIYALTPDCIVTHWSDAAAALFGWQAAEVVGRLVPHIPEAHLAEAHTLTMRAIYGRESIRNVITRRRRRDGSLFDARLSCGPIASPGGEPSGAVYVVEDVSETLRFERLESLRYEVVELTAGGAPLETVFDRLIDAWETIVPGAVGAVLRVCGDHLEHVAYGAGLPPPLLEALDGTPSEGPAGTSPFLEKWASAQLEPAPVADIATDPAWRPFAGIALAHGFQSCWSVPIRTPEQRLLGFAVVYCADRRDPYESELRNLKRGADIASLAIAGHAARAKLEDMALHDALTELPNRTLFDDRLQQAIANAERSGRRLAVGLLDLSRFKVVNDEFGHAVGDALLTEVASRLRGVVRPGDTIARMGGDEFLILISDVETRADIGAIAERFLASLKPSFTPGGRKLAVGANLGISVYPDDATEPAQLLRLADAAMYVAKGRGGDICFHAAQRPADLAPGYDLRADLERALERQEFELHYQREVSLANGHTTSAEALLRWVHPQLGVLAPDQFVALAEEAGLMLPIGRWVLGEACAFARRWADAGGPGVVSVNLSARQFEQRDFVASVVEALERQRLEPSRLRLELTEDMVHRSPLSAAGRLSQLRALGVRAAVDDFGSGYSSLNFMKRLPVDGLKIDRSFVREVAAPDAQPGDEAIVGAILAVGRALRLQVVAAGIETAAQRGFLHARGCEYGQGFLFSRPVRESEFIATVRA
jgi:diguanylate cyclase (GGDEF)-like protein/PAS domain S-box-containing protein